MELKREDLFSDCTACNGTGLAGESWRDIPGGRTRTVGGDCEACDGRGIVLTPAGEVLADLVDRLNRVNRGPV